MDIRLSEFSLEQLEWIGSQAKDGYASLGWKKIQAEKMEDGETKQRLIAQYSEKQDMIIQIGCQAGLAIEHKKEQDKVLQN